MVKLTEVQNKVHRFVRFGDEVRVGGPNDMHRDLVKEFGYTQRVSEITTRLNDDAADKDMGLVARIGKVVTVGEYSATFDFPPQHLLPEARGKTVRILRERYPEETIISDQGNEAETVLSDY